MHFCIKKLLLFLIILLLGSGCKKREDTGFLQQQASEPSPTATLPDTERAAPYPPESTDAEGNRSTRLFHLKTVEGIIYLSGNDSLSSLAVEIGDGTVMILVGTKAAALRAHQHQKVSLTGFWRPAAEANSRDTLEVADYKFLRD